ncbi:sensor histidine kinase [Catenulispora sp. NF23]|uniref:sensor histidine kinase n=1 Tax=Catenulispora pinistramenti TaxID=2705254 RepID=UPI001BA7B1B7|nr:histidine kinase [Catenulispora pinistramenti]MBS2538306.1 sensor histidine kinase [Catenulispora pinistramenti]
MNASPHRLNQLRRLTAQHPPAGLVDAATWVGALVFAWLLFDGMQAGGHPMLISPATVDLNAAERFQLALLSAVPVLVGRRRPVTALVGVLAGATFLTVLGEGSQVSLMGATVLVGVIAAARPRWIAVTAMLGTFTLWSLLELVATPSMPTPYGRLSRAVLVLAVAFIGGVLVRERRENRRALREQLAVGAITAERLRIARELHDMVAHSIGIVAIQAGAAKRCIQTQPVLAAEALDVIETTSRQTLTGLRHMLVALRKADGDGDDNAPMPGLDDLPALADNAAKAGVAVRLRFDGERRALPAEVDLSAYRIVQESVTNVVRHAGVPQCRVAIVFRPEEVVIEVVDDGRGLLTDPLRTGGFGVGSFGFGLAGMRERASLLNGSFAAGPRPEGGFRVEARIPA